jgi:hypothetical protein
MWLLIEHNLKFGAAPVETYERLEDAVSVMKAFNAAHAYDGYKYRYTVRRSRPTER